MLCCAASPFCRYGADLGHLFPHLDNLPYLTLPSYRYPSFLPSPLVLLGPYDCWQIDFGGRSRSLRICPVGWGIPSACFAWAAVN